MTGGGGPDTHVVRVYHEPMQTPEARPVNVVLAPGCMLDHHMWADVEPGLRKIGRLSYADLSQDSSIEAMADRLLSEAPERFVLIGFSLGGYVAREAARRAPTRILGLVLIATSSRANPGIQARRRTAVADQSDVARFVGLSRHAVLLSLAADHAHDAMVDRIRAMGERLGPDVFQRQSNLMRPGDTDRLADIACPVLVIAAAEDRLRSLDEARELHDGIRQSTLVTIARSGHMIPLEAPDTLTEAIVRWWSGARPVAL